MRKFVKWAGVTLLLFCAGVGGVVAVGARRAKSDAADFHATR